MRNTQRRLKYLQADMVSKIASFFLGIALVTLGTLLPWTEFVGRTVVLAGKDVPWGIYLAALILASVPAGIIAWQALWSLRALRLKQRLKILAVIFVAAGSSVGTWFGFVLPGTLRPYEYRGTLQCLLCCTGAILVFWSVRGYAVWRLWWQPLLFLRRYGRFCTAGSLGIVVIVASSAIGGIVLEGIPRIHDAVSYLFQGRMLWDGNLAIDLPKYLELFAMPGKGLELIANDSAGFCYGKYPPGWPLILGGFDASGFRWLAAPVLAGGIVVSTFRVVRRLAGARIATLTTVFLAGCPWLWYSAATQMSHIAACFWLMMFLDFFTSLKSNPVAWRGLVAGSALAMAIVTRPSDAFFFALPCIGVSLLWCWRHWPRYLLPCGGVALGGTIGAIIYLGLNHCFTGSSLESGYGQSSIFSAFLASLPPSPLHLIAWSHENLVQLSLRSYTHTVPAGLLVAVGLFFGFQYARKGSLLIICTLAIVLCYSLFVFGGRAWLGPRYLLPALPGIAFVIACGHAAAMSALRTHDGLAGAARAYLSFSVVALLLCWFIAVPANLAELRAKPPHMMTKDVARAVESAELKQAVVALPMVDAYEKYRVPNYKFPRTGLWLMDVPIETNSVVFVMQVDGWQKMARRSFPDRVLYWMDGKPGNFDLHPATQSSDSNLLTEQDIPKCSCGN